MRLPGLTMPALPAVQTNGMWAAIRAIHRAAHLTIAVSPATAAELVEAGACDRKAVKVRGWLGFQCTLGSVERGRSGLGCPAGRCMLSS